MGGVPFHILTALALVIFAAGLLTRVRFWLTGQVPGAGVTAGQKALRVLSAVPRVLGRPETTSRLFWNVIVQRQIWRQSPGRWLMHMTIGWSFLGLFFIGSLGDMFNDMGLTPFLEKDTAWFAAINDAFGFFLLAGVSLALARRFAYSQPHIKTTLDDAVVLVILGAMAASGFLLEGSRYLKEATPSSEAQYAFLGYAVSLVFDPLGLNWEAVFNVLWWGHAILGLALVCYIPYSKLLHIFTAPATIVLNTPETSAIGRREEVTV